MSFDPFEVRLQFLGLLRKLTASQQSIQSVVSYALKYCGKCGEDLWDCIMEEFAKGTLNSRINILYFLDTLCDPTTSLGYSAGASTSSSPLVLSYPIYMARDLPTIIDLVVPETREGVLNLLSTKQILDSWRVRRVVSPELCDTLLSRLSTRRTQSSHPPAQTPASRKRPHALASFSRSDTLRRMEEDRERHKRLRERMWVLPIPLPPAAAAGGAKGGLAGVEMSPGRSPFTPASPGVGRGEKGMRKEGLVVAAGGGAGTVELGALEIEFEQIWETAEELGEEDWKAMREQAAVCEGKERLGGEYAPGRWGLKGLPVARGAAAKKKAGLEGEGAETAVEEKTEEMPMEEKVEETAKEDSVLEGKDVDVTMEEVV